MSGLPMGKVGDLCEQIRGVTYSKSDAVLAPRRGFKPVLRANNITDRRLTFDDLVFVPESNINARQYIKKNDIVIATSSGSIDVVGKAAMATMDFDGGFGAFCKVLRPSKAVDPSYFSHYFQTKSYRQRISQLAAGANINNLRNEHLNELEIPLPPLAEQRRIAVILDKADALRAKRREAIAKLDQLLQSVFLDLFGDVSSNNQGWPEVAFGDLVESTKLGLVRGASEFGDGPEFDVPYIRMDAIGRGGEFLPQKVRMTKATVQEIKESSVRYGDFLFNTRNSKELVGKSTVFERDSSPWTFNNNMMRVRFTDRANPFYMLRYLMSRRGQMEMEKRKSGTTSVFAVYYKDLKTLPIVLPPKSLQDKFQRIVEDQRRVRVRVVEQELHVQSLMQALQHAAFSGQL